MGVHFTIVIPTINRLSTFRWTLETCVNQDYDNFRIIIADNNCVDGTGEYLRDRKFKNLCVMRSDTHLSMTENWDRIAQTLCNEDTYVHYLGDDDGLLPGSLSVANDIIERTGEKAINWRKVEYSWPNLLVPEFRNCIDVPLSKKMSLVDSSTFLENCHNFTASYTSGPGLYSSFVHSSILKSIYDSDGSHVLRALAPDVYSSFVVSAVSPRYLRCQFALSINGGSGYSNGVAYIFEPNSDRALQFKTDSPIHANLIHAPSIYVAEADSLLCARDVHRNWFQGYKFNWHAFLGGLASDMRQIQPGDPKRAAIGAVVEKVGKDQGITLSPDEFAYVGGAAGSRGPVYGLNLDRLCLIADMKPIGIENVLGASQFVDAIMPLSSLEWEIEQKTGELRQPSVAEAMAGASSSSLLRRAVRRACRYVGRI